MTTLQFIIIWVHLLLPIYFRVFPRLSDQPFIQNSSKWSTETGYEDPRNPNAYPYRPFGIGRRESFTAITRVLNSDLDFVCGGAIEGYKIAFHAPNELPSVWKKHYHVSANQAAIFMVAPNLISTSSTLRRHSPMTRQCYFNAERKLKYYQHYTQHNCEAECLMNYTLIECGCVHFAMPSKENVLNIRILEWNLVQLCFIQIARIPRNENMWNTTSIVLSERWKWPFFIGSCWNMQLFTILHHAHLWSWTESRWVWFLQSMVQINVSTTSRICKVKSFNISSFHPKCPETSN